MKWFKWLRRPKSEHDTRPEDSSIVRIVSTTSRAKLVRSEVATHPLNTLVEPRDALLRFARDYLVSSGAKVRVEDSDVLTATLVDGRLIRYTTSLARARNEEQTELLVQGGTVLAELLDECASRSRVVPLHLWETGDPLSLAEAALAIPLPACTGCNPASDGLDIHGTNKAGSGLQYCEQCPVREGRTILEGFGPIAGKQERRRRESRTIELTFHMISTDRSGRHDEWKRIAFDLTTGREVALLSLESVLRMETDNGLMLEKSVKTGLEEAIIHGQALLAPSANALAAFLRLRGEEDYQRRCHDISTTYDRLLREGGEDRELIHDAFQRELTRLADTYAVEVDVQLDSIAIISSLVAEVALRDKAGKTITVNVDLGRACMLPLYCDICGRTLQAGRRCREGHLVCTPCTLGQRQTTTGEICSICTSASAPESLSIVSQYPSVQQAPKSGKLAPTPHLQIEDLDAMTSESWHLCATWLLERMGYMSQRTEVGENSLRFFGQLDNRQFAASALRLPKGVAIGKVEVQNVAALRSGAPEMLALLLTTAPASLAANTTALQLGVTLLEQTSLAGLLEQLEAAHILEVAAEVQATEERALHAEMTRARLLAELDLLEDTLARAVNTHKAGSRARLLEAVEAISSAKTTSTQAFVAWETLATDWNASFGEHEGRDGSLLITADPATLDEMGERAQHLTAVTQQAFQRIQNTPGTGELGYSAWRKAILEELLARCDAVRWRVAAIMPTAWQEYALARDFEKLQQAEQAATMATYARGRAEKALAQLQTRARIAITK